LVLVHRRQPADDGERHDGQGLRLVRQRVGLLVPARRRRRPDRGRAVKLSQVRMLVDDPAEAFRFYHDELGLEPTWGEEGEAYASFAAGDGAVAIFVRDEMEAVVELHGEGDGALLVLEVDDVDEWVRKL